MSDDVRQASERILANRESPEYLMSDARRLAEWALPLLDETLIDETFLRQNFKRDDERPYYWINGGWTGPEYDLQCWDDGDWLLCDGEDEIILSAPKTIGDVRQLCRALGIRLTEPARTP